MIFPLQFYGLKFWFEVPGTRHLTTFILYLFGQLVRPPFEPHLFCIGTGRDNIPQINIAHALDPTVQL